MTNYFHLPNLESQLPEIPPDSIVSRTLYQDDNLRAILFGFAAGQELSEHTASKPATLHFLQGEATLTLGNDTFEVKPGTWVQMQPNCSHSIHAKTQLVMLLSMLEK